MVCKAPKSSARVKFLRKMTRGRLSFCPFFSMKMPMICSPFCAEMKLRKAKIIAIKAKTIVKASQYFVKPQLFVLVNRHSQNSQKHDNPAQDELVFPNSPCKHLKTLFHFRSILLNFFLIFFAYFCINILCFSRANFSFLLKFA